MREPSTQDTKEAGAKRRRWFLKMKRQLVAETLEPGSSVSIVARRHDVNANQLFKWWHELAVSTPAAAALVPVAVMPKPATEPVVPKPAPGRIEIVLSGGRPALGLCPRRSTVRPGQTGPPAVLFTIPATAVASIRKLTWPTIPGSCRPTPTAGSPVGVA